MTAKAKTEALLVDLLDEASAEIEEATATDPTFGGLAETYEYVSADLSLDGSGEGIVGTLSLAFDVTVYTKRDNPRRAL